jgi:hypothetical protein
VFIVQCQLSGNCSLYWAGLCQIVSSLPQSCTPAVLANAGAVAGLLEGLQRTPQNSLSPFVLTYGCDVWDMEPVQQRHPAAPSAQQSSINTCLNAVQQPVVFIVIIRVLPVS